MEHARLNKGILIINIAVLISAIGYGISFPLLAIRLESLGASGAWIGLNAAMPALGWIIGSLAAPWLQRRFGIRAVTLGFLALAFLAIIALAAIENQYWPTTALRFLFGGSAGMFYRSLEYWINGVSESDCRGRNIAANNVAFMIGLAIGSTLQPEFDNQHWVVFGLIAALFALSGLVLFFWRSIPVPEVMGRVDSGTSVAQVAAVPAAFCTVLAYGLYEDIPAYLMSIYALKNGLGETIAAYTLTAAAIGNILVPIPLAMHSDRVGRLGPLVFSAGLAILLALVIPFTLRSPMLFLTAFAISAGCAGALYNLSLALIGDRFHGADLVTANATLGLFYATGSLFGPLLNGAALDHFNTHGMLYSCAAVFISLVLMSALLQSFFARRVAT